MPLELTDEITPLGAFPLLNDIYLKGGWQTVLNNTARDAIGASSRKIGMVVYTTSTSQAWILGPGITNGDWTLYTLPAAAHAASHLPGGSDALSTAAPVKGIGDANSVGLSTSFSRSDHDHKLRTTTGPTDLAIGAVADGEFLKRVGTTIVSAIVGAAVTVQEEGVTQSATVTTFNFVGSAITASGGGSTATITVSLGAALGGSGGIVARRTVTGPTTVSIAATDHFIMVDTTAGAVTLTLPDPSTTDRIYEIKDIAGTFGTNACTLARNAGGDQIEGLVADYLLEANWQVQRVGSNAGTKWFLL